MGSESLSSAFGWVSIACWLVVFSPQIIENYQLQSGEGLSVAFVLIWLAGDLCNFLGAILARLQGTVIILGIYYAICDMILMSQIYYYRWKSNYRSRRGSTPVSQRVRSQTENGEQAPLLGAQPSQPEQPNSHLNGLSSPSPKISGEPREEKEGVGKAALRYTLLILFVIAVGLAAWFISRQRGGDGESSPGGGREDDDGERDVIEWKSQLIGWTSAVLYLGSRIPQIFKNFETRCEGLSLALFLFSIVGNVTYVLSICTESMALRHLIANASWLAGSGLTVFLDVFVLCQFFYFRRTDARYIEAAGAAGTE